MSKVHHPRNLRITQKLESLRRSSPPPSASKTDFLLNALRLGNVRSENGDAISDFNYRNSDRLDFGSVSRGQLLDMLSCAYEHGLRVGGVR